MSEEAPGRSWRVRATNGNDVVELANAGVLDEVVVDQWLHLEQMDERTWWMRLGDASITIRIDAAGRPEVAIERDVY